MGRGAVRTARVAQGAARFECHGFLTIMTDGESLVSARARPPRRYSMRTGLLLLVFACIFPALVVASLAVYESYVIQKERIFRDTIFLARNLTAILDRELTAVEAGMQMLASSPDLVAGDLPAFLQRARDAVRFQIADSYVLTDRAGRQVLNTLVPYGTSLPMSRVPRDLDRVFESRAPVLKRPVHRRGQRQSQDRAGRARAARRGRDLQPERRPVAGAHRCGAGPPLLARRLGGRGAGQFRHDRRAHARYGQGQKAEVPALARAVQDESEGSLETLTKGTPVYTAFSRSALSGWTVAAGAPMTLVTTDLYRSIAWIALGTLAAFGLGLWLALKLASRLTSAVQGLVGPALALALGKVGRWRCRAPMRWKWGLPCSRPRGCWPMLSIWRTTTH